MVILLKKDNYNINRMKKLLLILLCLPMLGFGQTDFTSLLFQLIDSKDTRNVLESEVWRTNSVNNKTDEYDVSYNEFKLSKHIDFSEGNSSRGYFTIQEYSSYSNIITLKVYDKSFYNQFKNIIVNSGYKKTSQDVKYNTIELIYKKNPLQITFKEELSDYYQITLFNYRDQQKRYQSRRNRKKKEQHIDIDGKIWTLDINEKEQLYTFLNHHHQLFLNNQLDAVSRNYTSNLEVFHSMYNIDKDIAMKDHKDYLKSYKVIKSEIDKKTLNIFKRTERQGSYSSFVHYHVEYILDYEIIRLKDNKKMKFVLEMFVLINSENKIYSIYSHIIARE